MRRSTLLSVVIFMISTGVLFFMMTGKLSAVDVIRPVCNSPNAVETPEVCDDDASNSNNTTQNPIYGPDGILTRVINILSFIVGVAAVIAIMVAGFRYVTSNGDSSTTAIAQKTIIYGVVGLVVVAVAQTIVIFVLSKL